MKLRNKKTGEIQGFGNLQVYAEAENTNESQFLGNFDSFKQILEYYEDFTPKEPLIKDPKIRKAVRAWAEAIEANEVIISHSRHDYLKIIDLNADCDICFDYEIGYTYNETNYTITELCGEEEE